MFKIAILTLAEALLSPGDIGYKPKITDNATLDLGGILGQVYMYSAMVAILIIVIAGFIFVTANGDANRVAKAKQAILGSIVGLVVILFAFAITQFVISRIA